MNYAVIFSYSFDCEVAVYLFKTEEEAVQFLRDNYETELRIDNEENEWNSIGTISDDGWSAEIITSFGDRTCFQIGTIYN